MTHLIKTVSKFGARGAHICLPKSFIGKTVKIIIDEVESTPSPKLSYDKPKSIGTSPISKDNALYDTELDDEELDFVNRFKSAKSSYDQEILKSFALKRFGAERVKEILKRVA